MLYLFFRFECKFFELLIKTRVPALMGHPAYFYRYSPPSPPAPPGTPSPPFSPHPLFPSPCYTKLKRCKEPSHPMTCCSNADGRHTEKSFRNLVKWNRNQIVFTMHRLLWNQTGFRLDPNQNWNQIVFTMYRLLWNQTGVRLYPNQPVNGKYNLISVLI